MNTGSNNTGNLQPNALKLAPAISNDSVSINWALSVFVSIKKPLPFAFNKRLKEQNKNKFFAYVSLKRRERTLEVATDLFKTISHLGLHGVTDGDVPLDGEGSQGEG